MKRIEFIAPVEAIRGNMSGRQDLRYAENDNKAFESPALKRNYARNYTPRFIGAKVAATGKKYFTVKTKVCTHVTAKWKKAAALLGGAGAIFGAITSNKSSELYVNLLAQYIELQNIGETRSFRQCIMEVLRIMLTNKAERGIYSGPRGAVYIDNPWVFTGDSNVKVSDAVMIKFWPELATGPDNRPGVVFELDGQKRVGYAGAFSQGTSTGGDNFASKNNSNPEIITDLATPFYMHAIAAGQSPAEGPYVVLNGVYQTAESNIVPGGKYVTTEVAPA